MDTIIQAKILKGFRDSLPETETRRSILIETISHVFRNYGFVPIDTPALEYSEILLRKSEGETEKQVFRFTDNGNRDVALRFDLTVPFARFIAQHKNELSFPFKRYHIAKVWRGEKPQAGRYREFIQCDFDIVGADNATTDFEILNLMKESLHAIGVTDIKIHINHRGVFNAFLKKLQLHTVSEDILRIVDKLAKIGKDEVISQLIALFNDENKAQEILEYIEGSDTFEKTLALMENLTAHSTEAQEGILRLKKVYALLQELELTQYFVLDTSITRGLDYYTGIVYETFLTKLPSIGSICSGGRYDNLTGFYMKEKISGIGASIGLDRLLTALEELNMTVDEYNFIDIEIFYTNDNQITTYQKLAKTLRKSHIRVEVFPDLKKLPYQYTVAEKKGIPFGIIVEDNDALTLKNLKTREMHKDISVENIVAIVKNALDNSKEE